MQKLSLKTFSQEAAGQEAREQRDKMRRAQIKLTNLIFGSPIQQLRKENKDRERIVSMFLNISLKSFYQTIYESCLDSVKPSWVENYKENYKKIYAYIRSVIPNADRMTIGTFLSYVNQYYMSFEEYEDFDDEDFIFEEEDRKRVQQGKRLAELFFKYTFQPLLRRRGICYESVVCRLSIQQEKKRKQEEKRKNERSN